jgi:predicted ABC-type ATPase
VFLSTVLDRRPIVVALAGANGAGKSTFYDAILAPIGLRFVNADELALRLGMDPYKAAELADTLRRELVASGESFVFETVFSDPAGEKLKFLQKAEEQGYTVLLIFIGISTPELSDLRVTMRATAGGHDVPRQKLFERFPRTLNNLKYALAKLSNVWVYDHSDLDRGYVLVARKQNQQSVELFEPVPEWLRSLLP